MDSIGTGMYASIPFHVLTGSKRGNGAHTIGIKWDSCKTSTPMTSLIGFLDGYRCSRGAAPSHTAIGGTGVGTSGSFSIPKAQYAAFLERYCSELARGGTPSLTERPGRFFPVIADIDLSFNVASARQGREPPPRVHGKEFIKGVAQAYAAALLGISRDPSSTCTLECHVLQRDTPYVKKDGEVRDGLHLIFPHCVLTRHAQALLRQRAKGSLCNVLAKVPGQQLDVEDAVDSCYCDGNNWQMYGSAKAGRTPYRAAYTANITFANGRCVDNALTSVSDGDDWEKWVKLLSVCMSGPDQEWLMNQEAADETDAREFAWAERTVAALQRDDADHPNRPDDHAPATWGANGGASSIMEVERAKKLVKCLSQSRADSYESWRNVGFALHNISPELQDAWHEFSAKSAKYDRRICQVFWERLAHASRGNYDARKLRMGSLVHWAREDSPEEVHQVESDELTDLLVKAVTFNTHSDWGVYVCALMPGRLASMRVNGGKERAMWIFKDHRWVSEPDGNTIKRMLKEDVVNSVEAYMQKDGEDERVSKSCARAITSLKTKGFRDCVLGDVAENVADDNFHSKLDSARDLVGWSNGVFDLEQQIFRPGEPSDYISMSTGHKYTAPDDPTYAEVKREFDTFLEKVHVCPVLRKYCLDSLSVMMSGRIKFEHMHCWTGTGSNGKSRMIKLLDEGMGDYIKTLPSSLLTGVRPESGKPTPELCSAAGARIVVMSEVDGKATINVAVMKELSGGDKIAVRALYGASSTIKPQFSMIMTCNDLSKVDANDDGTWRRLKVLPHRSKFVFGEPQGDLEFKADNALDGRLEKWAPYFIAVLQSRYPSAVQAMREEPEEIAREVQSYRAASDRDADFVAQNLVLATPSDAGDDADAWALLDAYKRYGRDRDVTLAKLGEKLMRFGIPPPQFDHEAGTAVVPGYRLASRQTRQV